MVDRRAKGLLLRGGNARVVVVVILSREQYRRAEQRRNQLPVIVAARAPDEEADIAQRPAGSSAPLGDLGIALSELLDEPHRVSAVLILEAVEQRFELDRFDVLHAPPMRLRHGTSSRAWVA
jgi:hypothetical protein